MIYSTSLPTTSLTDASKPDPPANLLSIINLFPGLWFLVTESTKKSLTNPVDVSDTIAEKLEPLFKNSEKSKIFADLGTWSWFRSEL